MSGYETWLGLAEVSDSLSNEADSGNHGDAIRLSLSRKAGSFQNGCSNIASAVLETIVCDSFSEAMIRIHPVLYEFLSHVADVQDNTEGLEEERLLGEISVHIKPLPIEPSIFVCDLMKSKQWNICRIKTVQELDEALIHLSCIYLDPAVSDQNSAELKRLFSFALYGRIIMAGTTSLLSTPCGIAAVVVENVLVPSQNQVAIEGDKTCYRVKHTAVLDVHIANASTIPSFSKESELNSVENYERNIPGYESIVESIFEIAQLHGAPAAPSGILITGCTGVGKTRLISCVASRVCEIKAIMSNYSGNCASAKPSLVHWISASDLTFQASTQPGVLKTLLLPASTKDCALWVIDDLDVLSHGTDGLENSSIDVELLLVQSSILQAIDQLQGSCTVIGIARNGSGLPEELTKVGRLEKEFKIISPTQWQRKVIWEYLLGDDERSQDTKESWSTALASATAGCVASDLVKVYQDAWARAWAREKTTLAPPFLLWHDISEATRAFIPSQLSELDVKKPAPPPSGASWSQINDLSWSKLGGYALVKKRAFRHVVAPWKRFLNAVESPAYLETNGRIELPPPGVLFHGPSGCGKTMAANCLAASLGLPIIQVRATDLLDKWLGGSEALLRSLFARARAAAPCILFLDEIDAISSNRNSDDSNDVTSRVLSTFLNEMDGVSSDAKQSRVLVVACTNRLESLDSALLRPGRLQEHIYLGLPVVDDLVEILKLRIAQMPIDRSLHLIGLAEEFFSKGVTGADVDGICRDVCLFALRTSHDYDNRKLSKKYFDLVLEAFGRQSDKAEDA